MSKVFVTKIEYRDGGSDVLGPFTTIETAKKEILTHLRWTEEKAKQYKEFDSNFDLGNIYTEEETIETFEKEVV